MSIRENQKYTLEDISQRKQEVLQDIQTQQQVIAEAAQAIFTPFDQTTTLIKKLNTGMAIFDGFMIGMKIFKNLRRLFKRNRWF